MKKRNSNTMSDFNNDHSNSTKPKYCSTREVSNGTVKRPLYITIGPPCAGKTTFLQTFISENMIDITIDDQEGVYVPIHTKYFLMDQATPNDTDYLRKRMLYNLSLEQRIYASDNDEMRKVLQYLSSPEKYHNNNQGGILQFLTEQPNYSEMQSKWDYLQKKQQQQDSNTIPPAKDDTWAEALDRVLNEFINIPLPETVDLFVLDGIFKTAPRDNIKSKLRRPSGLNAAFSQLKRVAHTQPQSPIAWGNTNTVCNIHSYCLFQYTSTVFTVMYKFIYVNSILFLSLFTLILNPSMQLQYNIHTETKRLYYCIRNRGEFSTACLFYSLP